MYKYASAKIHANVPGAYPALKENKVSAAKFFSRYLFCLFNQVPGRACGSYPGFFIAVPDQSAAVETSGRMPAESVRLSNHVFSYPGGGVGSAYADRLSTLASCQS